MRVDKIFLRMLVATLIWVSTSLNADAAADSGSYKAADGLAVYLGVLPAAMVQGHPRGHAEEAMHGGVARGRHSFHVVAAVFDAGDGARIEDATIEASVTSRSDAAAHIAGVTRKLEPMDIAGTVTYGNYFTMRGDEPYRIMLTISRTKTAGPVNVEFSHDHRIR